MNRAAVTLLVSVSLVAAGCATPVAGVARPADSSGPSDSSSAPTSNLAPGASEQEVAAWAAEFCPLINPAFAILDEPPPGGKDRKDGKRFQTLTVDYYGRAEKTLQTASLAILGPTPPAVDGALAYVSDMSFALTDAGIALSFTSLGAESVDPSKPKELEKMATERESAITSINESIFELGASTPPELKAGIEATPECSE